MKFLNKWALIIGFCISTISISAQTIAINNATFPGLPATSCTNTFVDVAVTLGCINIQYNGASVIVTGNTINVNLDYAIGPICLPAIATNVENINMGMLVAGSYTVIANGILNGANVSSVSTSLTVNSCCSATPGFTASQDTICPGDSIYFSNTSTGATSQAWYVNNFQVSTATNHGQVFGSTGIYDIKLVVSAASCSDSVMDKIYVINSSSCCPASPGFVASSSAACVGDSVYFTNTSSNATSYKWYVGNNQVSSATDYGQVFTAGGNYTISLVADAGTCSDSISQTIQITDPVVNLGPDTMICREATVLLVAGFQYDSIFWSDGSRGATLNTAPGTYYVEVYKNGCYAADTVVVGEIPVVPADLGSDTILCAGDSIVFDVTRTGASYLWQDNSTGGAYTTLAGGTFWVEITEANGCKTSDTVTVTLDSCNSGLRDMEGLTVNIYPQPAGDWVNVSLPMFWDEFLTLFIMDMQGRYVLQVELADWNGRFDFDSSRWSEGIYVLHLKGENHTIYKKLIIKR